MPTDNELQRLAMATEIVRAAKVRMKAEACPDCPHSLTFHDTESATPRCWVRHCMCGVW